MQNETLRGGMMTMRAVSILPYHEIGPHPRSSANLDCFCTLAAFRLLMRFLEEHGIPVISAREARECMASYRREDTGVNGAQFPHKFGVDVLKTVMGGGFDFACWAYL